MEISVQGTHEETVRPEIGRLHARAHAEASDKNEVLRTATAVVQRLHTELKRLQEAGQVTEIVVRPITTSSWRPIVKGRQAHPIFRAHAGIQADFTDFAALADLAAQFGATEGLELDSVEWRLTDATRRELEAVCLTRAVEQARDRAEAMARAAGAGEVTFVQLADPGLLGDSPSVRQSFAASMAAPMSGMMRGAKMADDQLAGIELQPEDLTVSAVVQARLATA
ncbi:MAG TPA: SIMPL domain-containing protein [Micropruina sp.]|nr:SIMPL domain-containing protein [Propionibacterium sp.]HMR22822.1 SIMPL domain-containing protein [Micropruina sp.]